MRVLLTGGAGFIGSHVADAFAERGHEVVVVDRLHPRAHAAPPDYLREDVEYLRGGLDAATLDAALAGIDAVCHQAAMVGLGRGLVDAGDYVRDNDLGTAELLAAIHRRAPGDRPGRLVLASSMVVYGEGAYRCDRHGAVRPGPRELARLERGQFEPTCPRCGGELAAVPIGEDAPPDPRNVYAATKLHQEHLAQASMHEGGPAVTALRYHNVYGPRMPADTPYSGVAAIFRSALAGARRPRSWAAGGPATCGTWSRRRRWRPSGSASGPRSPSPPGWPSWRPRRCAPPPPRPRPRTSASSRYQRVANSTCTARVCASRSAPTTGARTRQASSWRVTGTSASGTRNWKMRSTSPLLNPQLAAASRVAMAAASSDAQARSRTTANARAASAPSRGTPSMPPKASRSPGTQGSAGRLADPGAAW